MSDPNQTDAPPKRCGFIFENNNPCARAFGHSGCCVIQDGWCDRHSAYTHQIPRDDGKPTLYVCVPCLQESQQQLRLDDAGIREGIAATRRELVSMITGKFAQVDTHTEATRVRLDDQSARIADLSKEFNWLNELHPIVVSNAAFVGKLEVLDGKHGEDGCGMFKTYNAALNDLRGELRGQRDRIERIEAKQRRPTLRSFSVAFLRWLALRLEARP